MLVVFEDDFGRFTVSTDADNDFGVSFRLQVVLAPSAITRNCKLAILPNQLMVGIRHFAFIALAQQVSDFNPHFLFFIVQEGFDNGIVTISVSLNGAVAGDKLNVQYAE